MYCDKNIENNGGQIPIEISDYSNFEELLSFHNQSEIQSEDPYCDDFNEPIIINTISLHNERHRSLIHEDDFISSCVKSTTFTANDDILV